MDKATISTNGAVPRPSKSFQNVSAAVDSNLDKLNGDLGAAQQHYVNGHGPKAQIQPPQKALSSASCFISSGLSQKQPMNL